MNQPIENPEPSQNKSEIMQLMLRYRTAVETALKICLIKDYDLKDLTVIESFSAIDEKPVLSFYIEDKEGNKVFPTKELNYASKLS